MAVAAHKIDKCVMVVAGVAAYYGSLIFVKYKN